jgi:hypothetical protein
MANNIAIAITADVADLTAKMAVAKAEMNDAAKSMRASAQSVIAAGGWTSASDEIKRAALEAAEAQAKAQNTIAVYSRELRNSREVTVNTADATGQMKFAMRDLSYQVNDVATMLAMGAPPMQIFASQGGQVIGALQMMTGEAKGLLGFLGGPWGMVITSAAMVLTPLIAKLFDTRDAANDAKGALYDLIDAQRKLAAEKIKPTMAAIDLNKLRDERLRLSTKLDLPIPKGFNEQFEKENRSYYVKRLRELEMKIAEGQAAIDAAEGAAKPVDRTSTRSPGPSTRVGSTGVGSTGGGARVRSEGAGDAARQAREQAQAAQQAAREELQERIAINQQMDTLAEDRARTDIDLSRIALQAKLANIDAEQRAGSLSGAKAVQARADVNRQMARLDQDLEDRLYNAKLAQLQKDRSNYNRQSSEYRSYTRQIEVLEQAHLNRMAVLKAQADAKERAGNRILNTEMNRRMQGMAGTWAQSLARMATLQQGFSATVQGLWQGIANVAASIIEDMLAKWIQSQLIKIGLIKTESTASVATQAALAGAGGVASMAAAPFPINTTAPAFGAAMYGAAAAFGQSGMASFAAGTNQLPNDMIAQVHAGERIVPRADNEALLALTKRGAGMMDQPGSRSRGGDGMTVHLHVSAVDAQSVRRLFLQHGDKIAQSLSKATRNGWRP